MRRSAEMSDSTLTELQRLVLELFFKLPEADGFVLAGGAALVASGLTERPTQDVDLFGSDVVTGIAAAADALEAACTDRGWTTERIRDTATFRRLVVRSPSDELLVDLAVDSPPLGAPTITAVGPTYPPRELAARKLLALFDRAEARDFVDVHTLSERFDLDDLLDFVGDLDEGFTPALFAEMLASHRRYSDDDLLALGGDPPRVRAFADAWASRLQERNR
jgi:hypothetical protein